MSEEDVLANGATAKGERQVGLENAVRCWPTPDANVMNDGEGLETWDARRETLKAKAYNGNGAGEPLAIAVQRNWATPKARDWRSANGREQAHSPPDLNEMVARSLWPTPTGGDAKASGAQGYSTESGRHPGTTLTDATVRLWPTPHGMCSPNKRQAGPSGNELGYAVNTAGPQEETSRKTNGNRRVSLNPDWVEALQGWPVGHTSIRNWLTSRSALTALEPSATDKSPIVSSKLGDD